MRVEFTNLGLEPPEKNKPGRATQTGTIASPPAASERASAAAAPSAAVDRTRFSFDQARVASLKAKVLAAPELRQEKVEPLERAVASGNYSVDSRRVADAMAAEFASGRVR